MKNMQCYQFAFILLFTIIESLSSKGASEYRVVGHLNGLRDSSKVFLVTNGKSRLDTLDVAFVKNGYFTFKGSLSRDGCWCFVMIPAISKHQFISLILSNDNDILINGEINKWPDVSIGGSEATEDCLKFTLKSNSINKVINDLKNSSLTVDSFYNGKQKRLINQQILKLSDSLSKFRRTYIEEHPFSYYSAFLLRTTSKMPWKEKEMEFNKLTTKVQESMLGFELKQDILKLEKQDNIKVGGFVPDFVAFDPNGKSHNLYEILNSNRITLIDFWASWCSPCRMQTPELYRIYYEFHNKGFNIVSISLDYPQQINAWKDAIRKDKMIWQHLSELRGRQSEFYNLFGLNGIPAYLLVDSEGKILGTSLPGNKLLHNPNPESWLINPLSGDLYLKINELLK